MHNKKHQSYQVIRLKDMYNKDLVKSRFCLFRRRKKLRHQRQPKIWCTQIFATKNQSSKTVMHTFLVCRNKALRYLRKRSLDLASNMPIMGTKKTPTRRHPKILKKGQFSSSEVENLFKCLQMMLCMTLDIFHKSHLKSKLMKHAHRKTFPPSKSKAYIAIQAIVISKIKWQT